MAGKATVLKKRQRKLLDNAIEAAEDKTGLEFCVYLGPTDVDARARAESLFVEAGLHERPAVLLLVAPDRRRVEIITAPAVRDRLPDAECARAIGEMTPAFAGGRFVDGLIAGLRLLADAAGEGTREGPELPNIVDDN